MLDECIPEQCPLIYDDSKPNYMRLYMVGGTSRRRTPQKRRLADIGRRIDVVRSDHRWLHALLIIRVP